MEWDGVVTGQSRSDPDATYHLVFRLVRHVLECPGTPGSNVAETNPHAFCGLSCLFAMRSPAGFTCVQVLMYVHRYACYLPPSRLARFLQTALTPPSCPQQLSSIPSPSPSPFPSQSPSALPFQHTLHLGPRVDSGVACSMLCDLTHDCYHLTL